MHLSSPCGPSDWSDTALRNAWALCDTLGLDPSPYRIEWHRRALLPGRGLSA